MKAKELEKGETYSLEVEHCKFTPVRYVGERVLRSMGIAYWFQTVDMIDYYLKEEELHHIRLKTEEKMKTYNWTTTHSGTTMTHRFACNRVSIVTDLSTMRYGIYKDGIIVTLGTVPADLTAYEELLVSLVVDDQTLGEFEV